VNALGGKTRMDGIEIVHDEADAGVAVAGAVGFVGPPAAIEKRCPPTSNEAKLNCGSANNSSNPIISR
jgi:hypothetical protein